MIRRSVCIAGLAVALIVLGLFAGSQIAAARAQHTAPAAAEVKIDNFSFGPGTLTVPIGTMVTWRNRDDIPHTVVSTEGVFKSKVLDSDERFSFTFTKAGIFPYFCSVHPKMMGKIVVQ